MNQDQEHPAKKDHTPPAGSSALSRRSFLQKVGAVTLGALAAQISIPASLRATLTQEKALFQEATRILTSSPLTQQALRYLSAQGLQFDMSRVSGFLRDDRAPELVGLYLPSTSSPPGVGNVLIPTVDLRTGHLSALSFSKYWCVDDELHSSTLMWDGSGQLVEFQQSILLNETTLTTSLIETLESEPDRATPHISPGKGFQGNSCTPSCSTVCGPWMYDGCCSWTRCDGYTYYCTEVRVARTCTRYCLTYDCYEKRDTYRETACVRQACPA